jgi:hypothetical protein
MPETVIRVDDWAQDVAERLVGDIPHTIFVRWAADVPERVAAMLRSEFAGRSSDGRLNGLVEEVIGALPHYLPASGAARMRAKLIGALLTAGALGALVSPGALAQEVLPP